MRFALAAVIATLALWASVSAQQPDTESAAQAETISRRPPWGPFAPTRAVDHVAARLVIPNASKPDDDYREVVTRSGDWLRTDETRDGRRKAVYSNLATGVAIVIQLDEAGKPIELTARRDRSHDVYVRAKTGETDTLLGEACQIWRTAKPDWPEGMSLLSCATSDGIELWSRTLYPWGGIGDSVEAIAVERRPVRAAELTPPTEALDWRMWRRSVAAMRGGPNVEVRLAPEGRRRPELIIRRRDGWTYRELSGDGRYGELSHEASGLLASYSIDGNGQALDLSIERPARGPRPPDEVNLNRTDFVLGERCTWFDTMPGTEDAGESECRTRDGAILVVSEYSWGTTRTFKATSIRRGVVAEADMRPPADAFAWLR